MRKTLLTLFTLFMFLGLWSQPLLLEENFDYPVGTMLVETNGWVEQGSSFVNEFTISAGNLSYPSYESSNIGNYLEIKNSGEDAYKEFTSQNSGSVYAAFLINVTDAKTTGDYFFAFQPSPGNTNFTGRFFIKKDASNAIAFGISKGTEAAVYTNFNYSLNTTYLIVIKYEMIAGLQNDILSIFVNPTISSVEPTPLISTNGGTTSDPTALNTVLLRQGTATAAPTLFIDGIRVATTWEEAVKEADTQAPMVTFNPPSGTNNVTINVQPTITFSEPVRNIDNSPIDNTNVANLITFKLNDINGQNVSFSATINANKTVITITPNSQLNFNQTYFLQLAPVEDNSNNATTTLNTTFITETANNEAEILSFTIPGQISSNINSANATVSVVMPFGTNLSSLTPTITVSSNATINPASGVSQNFTNPVTYTVTSQNGTTTKQWTVTVTTQQNNEAEILTFTIPNQISSSINSQSATVNVVMPHGTNITSLTPNITISAGATINPASGASQNFTNPVTYTVTAQDGITNKQWTVNVSVQTPTIETLVMWTFPNNPDDNIADGGIPANQNKTLTCTASGTVTYTTATGTTTSTARCDGWDNGMNTKYWMIEFTTAGYKDITLSSKLRSSNTGPKDFMAQYSLDAITWFDIAPVTVANNFTTGVLTDVSLPAACNNQNTVYIRWIMTSNTNVQNGTVASTGASNIDDIYVKGIAFVSNEAEILSFNIPNQISSIINSSSATVNVVMPHGTSLSNLTPNITVSAGATINPASGASQNFNNPVTYTVTAQDGITNKIWTVTVSIEQANNETEILSFTIPGQFSSNINSANATVSVIMPFGTNLSSLTPTITISAGATINPASGVPQNFTNPVTYTVTAQDGITNKIWTVNVTAQLNNEAEILTFTIPNQVSSTINSQNATVNVLMPYGTSLSSLTPTITISAGATINPASGVSQNFTNPVTYTVTAQNGTTTKTWTVTVTHDNPVYHTIVEWTFPNNPDDSIADGGITANLDKIITCTASGTAAYNVAGATTSAARATGWDNGADTKYWRVDFTTQGYMMIQFSSKQRSSSTGPKDFKVQYMINNDDNWIDVPNATVVAADNFTSGVLNNIELPSECENKALVSLRWIMTSNTSVAGATVSATGASRIDDIIVKGVEIPLYVSNNDLNSFVIAYPNPASEIVHVKASTNILETHILTLQGKTVKISKQPTIYVGDLTNGIYLMVIKTENQVKTIRFVKQ